MVYAGILKQQNQAKEADMRAWSKEMPDMPTFSKLEWALLSML